MSIIANFYINKKTTIEIIISYLENKDFVHNIKIETIEHAYHYTKIIIKNNQ